MLISDLPIVMIRCLVITIIVEVLLAVIMGYRKKDLVNVLLVNILTNPLLNSLVVYVNFYYGLKYRNIALLILEIIVVLIEGFIYQKYLQKRKINGYILSFILNTASYLLGIVINDIIY